MMRSWGMRWLLASALLACQVVLAQSNPIQLASEIYLVHESGEFEPATGAFDGAVVEYRIFASNTGPTTLPAGRVTITGPVLAGFRFVPGSATPSSERVLLEYSMDGASFSPAAAGSALGSRSVRAVRWTLLSPMEPGAVEVFVYRVVVGEDYPVPEWALVGQDFSPEPMQGGLPPADQGSRGGRVSGGGGVSAQGFQVVSYDARWEGDYLWVVGEVRNTGNVAAGVELQVIARDAAGRLVDVATFWPGSIENIRPGMSYGFRHPVTRERSAVRVEVQIVGTEVW